VEEGGELKSIAIRGGAVAFVSDEDHERVSAHRWSLGGGNASGRYASARVDGSTVLMHRLILSAPAGLLVDHVDGNRLNNQRENLRLCTGSQNLANARPRVHQYKGISRKREGWAAFLSPRHGVTKRNLGTYATAEEAAAAYDIAAREHFGEFARTNFPHVRAAPLTLRQKLLANPPHCEQCGALLRINPRGIARKFCNGACSAAYRRRRAT